MICARGEHGSPYTAQWLAGHFSDMFDMHARATMHNVNFMATIVHRIDNHDAHRLTTSAAANHNNNSDADDVN